MTKDGQGLLRFEISSVIRGQTTGFSGEGCSKMKLGVLSANLNHLS